MEARLLSSINLGNIMVCVGFLIGDIGLQTLAQKAGLKLIEASLLSSINSGNILSYFGLHINLTSVLSS